MPAEVKADPVARAEWNRRVDELIETGVLTVQDQTEFAEYCLQHSLCVRTWEKIKKSGIEKSILTGVYKARLASVHRRAQLAARFGFTPSDRNQVKVTKKPADPLEDFKKLKRAAGVVNMADFREKK